MLKRGPERQYGHLRSQDLQGFGGIPTLAHRGMRFMTLLFLAALAGALVCAYDEEAASAPGAGNPSHKVSAAQEENAGEDPRLARQPPKLRRQRSSLLEKGLEAAKKALGGVENLAKDAVDDLENIGKETIHDAKDILDSALQL
ncbi:dermcidin isoform X2 [Cebus imitator]|nr:dermcidin isoform X2 [Cebus imitator]